MANTYTLITSATVGSNGASSIEFTSIPNTFNDLHLVYSLRDDSTIANNDGILTINGSDSSFARNYIYSYTGGTFADNQANNNYIYANTSISRSSTFTSGSLYIPSYTSNTRKAILLDNVAEDDSTTRFGLLLLAGAWNATPAAITSLKFTPSGSGIKYVQYSTFHLYGIKNS
jgi:hypothetical protein